MTKQGNLDNVVTYEHICDTFEDIQSIDPHYVTLGSTCVVINGESGGLEIYMADSNKEWQSISITGGESGGDIGIGIHICGNNEYDSITGEPTVEDPIENQFYLVPSSSSDSSNLFDEWIYINGNWEKFGDRSIDIPQQKQADWTQVSDTDESYIKNKPYIRSGVGQFSILESSATTASGDRSHAEGNSTTASGVNSHAEGLFTIASGANSHAEGSNTIASGSQSSHAEGINTNASGSSSHTEGSGTNASGSCSHAEGQYTNASGFYSHAEGQYTIANHLAQHVFGRYNIEDNSTATASRVGNYVEIVGNGTSFSARSNARTLDWNGNQEVAGDVIANACGGANPISLVGMANNMIAIQTTQPTAPETKLWISETTQTPVQVPTVQQMNSAIENATIDVQVNSVSVVQNGVANVPVANENNLGVIRVNNLGLKMVNTQFYPNTIAIQAANLNAYKQGEDAYSPVVSSVQHASTFYGLAKAAGFDEKDSTLPLGQYTDSAKSAISQMLNGSVTVTEATPTITALPDIRYVCGEVSTITIIPPASGIVNVVFESGTTPTVLTLPQTVVMPEWFDSTDLEANRVYEISIADGVHGVVTSWPA